MHLQCSFATVGLLLTDPIRVPQTICLLKRFSSLEFRLYSLTARDLWHTAILPLARTLSDGVAHINRERLPKVGAHWPSALVDVPHSAIGQSVARRTRRLPSDNVRINH